MIFNDLLFRTMNSVLSISWLSRHS